MSQDITLSLLVFSFFILILWRLNNNKKRRPKAALKSNTAPIASTKKVTATAFQASSIDTIQDKKDNEFFNLAKYKDVTLPEEFLSLSLLEYNTNDQLQKDNIKQICKTFRQPHPLLLPLTQSNFEPNALFDLIKSDPEMTAKILNRVNSSAFALRQPITSVQHAIIYLGIGTVKNIAMQFAMENSCEFEGKLQEDAYHKIWLASYLSSSIGLLLAKELAGEDAAEVSTRCLLNYLGDMALLSFQPELAAGYAQGISLYQRVINSQSRLNINSSIIGKTLCVHWQLPRSIVNSLSFTIAPLFKKDDMSQLSSEELTNTIICYLSCRIGEIAAYSNMQNLDLIKQELINQLDCYYLIKHREQTEINNVFEVLESAGVANKIGALLIQKNSK